ncbi:hypothetical protein WME91_40980 [Sorangium sp. So ce269]
MLAYMAIISVILPMAWLAPPGEVTKNLPLLAATWLLLALEPGAAGKDHARAPGQKGWRSGNVGQALRGNASGAHHNVFPLMAAQAAGIEGADSAQTLELPLDVPPPPLAAL